MVVLTCVIKWKAPYIYFTVFHQVARVKVLFNLSF